MLTLIGSSALAHHIFIGRDPKDIDVIGTLDEIMSFAKGLADDIKECYPIKGGKKYIIKTINSSIIEAEIAWSGSLIEDFQTMVSKDPDTIHFGEYQIPSLNVLYMLKMSHRYLKNSPHFLKTMNDIHLMGKYGAEIPTWYRYQDFYKRRMKETYSYGHPNLAVKKDTFFTGDGVNYKYDHDSIHLAMAHSWQPAYKFYQPEDSEVNVSKELFFTQPDYVRLWGVLEESYVLALERSQIPYPNKMTPEQSFDMALMKVCTSITSGWFHEYAWTHYHRIKSMYNENYVTVFKIAVARGIVKKVGEIE